MVKLWSSKSSLWVRILPSLMIYKFDEGFKNFKKLLFSWSFRNTFLVIFSYGFFFTFLSFVDLIMYTRPKKNLEQVEKFKKFNYAKEIFSRNSIWHNYNYILNDFNFLTSDKFFLSQISNQYKNFFFDNFRVVFRLNFFKNGFYMLYQNLHYRDNYFNILNSFLYGWLSVLNFVSKWFMPISLLGLFVYYSLIIKSLPFNKILFVWCALFMTFYWIISGFVFFFKKYQYGKFTSVIQRFWKRTLILFWLIEGGLLLVFVFLILNSNVYLYNGVNQMQIFQTHLFSWKIFLLKLMPTTILLLTTYLFLLNNKWQPLNKNISLIIFLTFLLLYITWVEFYQFYHLMNYYNNLVWSYEFADKFWVIKPDLRKTAQTNHIVSILLILKFWHVLFVLGVWLFFVLRSEESGRSRYPLIAANFLNFVMLYLLTWAYMYPWFKWFFRRYFQYSYKWFYQNNRSLSLRLIYNDLKILFISCLDYLDNLKNYYFLRTYNFTTLFSFKPANHMVGFVDFNKKFVYSSILSDILYINEVGVKTRAYVHFLYSKFTTIGLSFITFLYNLI